MSCISSVISHKKIKFLEFMNSIFLAVKGNINYLVYKKKIVGHNSSIKHQHYFCGMQGRSFIPAFEYYRMYVCLWKS